MWILLLIAALAVIVGGGVLVIAHLVYPLATLFEPRDDD